MTEVLQHIDDADRVNRLIAMDKGTLPPDGGPQFNRLIFATSPYLIQHAENPVDWFPWCEEAFAKARAEDKPVFLSIGYATCHWCHVMAHECFADAEVAAYLNDKFVAIKVDREERPDLDDQYMTVAQLLTGGGGWPLTILMTPEKKPFFAATYLPKTATNTMPSLLDVLEQVQGFWQGSRHAVEENCVQIVKSLESVAHPAAGTQPWEEVAGKAFQILQRSFDAEWKGFGTEPKFPLPLNCRFLLRFWKKSGAVNARWMAEDTLSMIRRGGVFDQVGFGVHRYAVDRQWLIPHFEKMLYDQAMLAHAYLDAFQATGEQRYQVHAEEIFSFVLDSMTAPGGGFFSAWDADSGGHEGSYYLWTVEELDRVLGTEDAAVFARIFQVTSAGNFEGRSILHLPKSLEDCAAVEGIPLKTLQDNLAAWRRLLLTARNTRSKPFRDEKILTAWNGLMISALAKGFAVTGNARYRQAAEDAINFILDNMCTESGRLLRSWFHGSGSGPGFLEDYACFVWGLLEFYDATLATNHLQTARRYGREMIRLFQDGEQYGLFDTAADSADVLVRKKGGHDGVLPSGNSIAAYNLIRLGKILDDERLLAEGEGILRAFMGSSAESPMTSLNFIMALDYLTGEETIATFTGSVGGPLAADLLHLIHQRFIPGLVLRIDQEKTGSGVATAVDDVAIAFCAKGSCRLPVRDRLTLEALLDEIV
jgi:uncharacterized protein